MVVYPGGAVATICVGFAETSVAAFPPKKTCGELPKLRPLIVTNVPPAIGPEAGDIEVIKGALVAVTVNEFDGPPPGAGLNTAKVCGPDDRAGSWAEIEVDPETVTYAKAFPSSKTLLFATNPEPAICIVVATPTLTAAGVRPVIAGTGLFVTGGGPGDGVGFGGGGGD